MNIKRQKRDNPRDRLTVFVIILGIITGCFIGVLFIFPLFTPSSKPEKPYHKIYEVTRAFPKNPESIPLPQSLQISQVIELRQLLENEQFFRLNKVLDEYQQIFEQDQTDEYKLYDAYQIFGCALASYEGLINNWIAATPDQYQPYLAMAHYYFEQGWLNRGTKWAKDTSREQFKSMGRCFEKSEANLKTALKMKSDLPGAYNLLMGIYKADGKRRFKNPWVEGVTGMFPNSPKIQAFIFNILAKIFKADLSEKEDPMEKLIDETSRRFPHSFLLKASVLWSKEPRWGGSYEQMETFAKQAEKMTDKNPKFFTLYGLIYYDQARGFRSRDDYDTALNLLEKALKFGDHWAVYNERAKIYHYDLKLFDKALEDAVKSARLRPPIYETRLMLSRIPYAKGDYPHSLDDLEKAERLNPGNPEIQSWREWASNHMMNNGHRLFKVDLQGAIEKYNICLEFNGHNFQAFYWRG